MWPAFKEQPQLPDAVLLGPEGLHQVNRDRCSRRLALRLTLSPGQKLSQGPLDTGV